MIKIKTQSPEIDIKLARKELVKCILGVEETMAENYGDFERTPEIDYQRIEYIDDEGHIHEGIISIKLTEI